jgi:hypothetical protein
MGSIAKAQEGDGKIRKLATLIHNLLCQQGVPVWMDCKDEDGHQSAGNQKFNERWASFGGDDGYGMEGWATGCMVVCPLLTPRFMHSSSAWHMLGWAEGMRIAGTVQTYTALASPYKHTLY